MCQLNCTYVLVIGSVLPSVTVIKVFCRLLQSLQFLPTVLVIKAVFRFLMDPGFFADPDLGFKSPDPSIYKLM